MTSEINETKLFYNNKNQIDSLVFFSSLTPDETESVYFTYDKNGNILDKKLYVNNKLIYRIEFVYNEKTGMLSSILKQEIATNFLSIIRFETKYFD
jgi:antitoxin component YwqK of YwqJK toxin-antitoxin module